MGGPPYILTPGQYSHELRSDLAIYCRKPEVETHTNLGLEAELDDLEDDVVVTDSSESIDGAAWNGQAMHSEPVPKIFIEQKCEYPPNYNCWRSS